MIVFVLVIGLLITFDLLLLYHCRRNHSSKSSGSSSVSEPASPSLSNGLIPKYVYISWPLRKRCWTSFYMKLTQPFPLFRIFLPIYLHSGEYQSSYVNVRNFRGSTTSTDTSPNYV